MKVGDLVRNWSRDKIYWGTIIRTFKGVCGSAKEAHVLWVDGQITHEHHTVLEVMVCK